MKNYQKCVNDRQKHVEYVCRNQVIEAVTHGHRDVPTFAAEFREATIRGCRRGGDAIRAERGANKAQERCAFLRRHTLLISLCLLAGTSMAVALAACFVTTQIGLPIWGRIAIAGIAGIVIAVAVGLLSFRSLYKTRLKLAERARLLKAESEQAGAEAVAYRAIAAEAARWK